MAENYNSYNDDLLAYIGTIDPALQAKLVAGKFQAQSSARIIGSTRLAVKLYDQASRAAMVADMGMPASASLPTHKQVFFIGRINILNSRVKLISVLTAGGPVICIPGGLTSFSEYVAFNESQAPADYYFLDGYFVSYDN